MTRVKICGVSEIEHALAASEAGADYLGLVFAPSPRQITPERAKQIVKAISSLRPRPEAVGVFVNKAAEEVNRIADRCQLDWIQLSGNETWQYCHEIERPIIKAIHIPASMTPEDIITEIEEGYKQSLKQELVLILDTHVRNTYGGTGLTFDWQIARAVSAKFPVIIAGGLTPDNAGQLVTTVQPWGVDVSSGVETDGRKDTAKIRAFIEAVKAAR